MQTCLSANGHNVYTGSDAPTMLLVGTIDGVVSFRRGSFGEAWEQAENRLPGVHVGALLCEPRNGGVFAGTYREGLFALIGEGADWERRSIGLTVADVWSLAVSDSGHLPLLFAGTEPPLLFASKDYGRSWEELPSLRNVPGRDEWRFPPPPHIAHVKTIGIDVENPQVIYVGIEQGGLLKSVDGGTTWRELDGYVRPSDVQYKDVHSLALPPLSPQTIYMSTGDGMSVSRDGGKTWTYLNSLSAVGVSYPDALAVSPVDEQCIFVAGASEAAGPAWREEGRVQHHFLRSLDGGQTWQSLTSKLPFDRVVSIEAITLHSWSDGMSVFAATATGEVFASDDGGDRWEMVGKVAPVSPIGHYRHFVDRP